MQVFDCTSSKELVIIENYFLIGFNQYFDRISSSTKDRSNVLYAKGGIGS